MLKALVLPVALLGAACSPPSQEGAAKSDMDSMNMSEGAAPAQAGAIRAMGTVTAIDASAGTISLDHEAIAAVNWPAMQMQFRAENPAMLQGIAVGDRVSFELKSASEPQVVTMVEKQ